MDTFNWMVMEMLTREAVRERLNGYWERVPETMTRHNPLTSALASSLVRLGLRLDPAAGEGLGALDISAAQSKGGN